MPTLYILCGIPASGKSTWSDKFIQKNPEVRYVSRDEIRLSIIKDNEDYFSHEDEVFHQFSSTIAQTLVDGFDCIADATHLNLPSRRKLTNTIDEYITEYQIVYVVFNIDIITCLERNRFRTGRACIPDKSLCSMFVKWNAPTMNEDRRAIKIRLVV